MEKKKDFMAGSWKSLQYYIFSTPECNLSKFKHETPQQVCVWAIVLKWHLILFCLLLINDNYGTNYKQNKIHVQWKETDVKSVCVPV